MSLIFYSTSVCRGSINATSDLLKTAGGDAAALRRTHYI